MTALVSRGYQAPSVAGGGGSGPSGVVVPFVLYDDDGGLAPAIDLSAAGVVQLSLHGAAFANRLGAAPTSLGDGAYYYVLDEDELGVAWVLLKIEKAGYRTVIQRETLDGATEAGVATAVANSAATLLAAIEAGGGASGSGGVKAPYAASYAPVVQGSAPKFSFFVQKMLIDTAETDHTIGKTGLVTADFEFYVDDGTNTFGAEAAAAVTEIGGGQYSVTFTGQVGAAVAGRGSVRVVYAPASIPVDYQTREVAAWSYPIIAQSDASAFAAAVWALSGEGSATYGDLIRLVAGVLAGKVSNFTTNTLAFKSLDGTKTRVTVTKDATGRTAIVIGDLT